ncbi:MAG TPA: amylo-alpha-1,6-glucosidase [Rhodothermales bacterium]|nr:amylo-alpha-1,6-glucosidase [Rhodothermales bacterium]
MATSTLAQSLSPALPSFAVSFSGQRGQLQVGGPYAGVEFHHSQPLPSRISFYAPVANSIDLSTDYWQRDASQPFLATLDFGGVTDTLGREPYTYHATPAQAVFSHEQASYASEISYQFGEMLPFMALRIAVTNREAQPQEATLTIRMAATLRTSHAYTIKDKAWTSYDDAGRLFQADFDDPATDSTRIFIANAGALPVDWGADGASARALQQDPTATFTYHKRLAPGEALEIVQLIGSCKQATCDAVLPRIQTSWQDDVAAYERRVDQYVRNDAIFDVSDSTLFHTMLWSKALLQADRHYIDGHIVPMPCPAQYNFFFTHDLLLTDLGAVMFDTERVKNDLRYVQDLARGDSLLPHAYYWREDGFKTEFANADNWNHLWLVILSASYLKHSGDHATVETLLPMIRQSLRIMLENERDGLMYASRPDWWDIGNVYGARAYITILTIRALQSYQYLVTELEMIDAQAATYAALADQMREQLVQHLWNDEAGYLLNMLNETTLDRHYYTGSLLAAVYDFLDDDRKRTLLETARTELLDEHIGIRNAMPPDFHTLTDTYRFNGPEVGAPYKYMNGGVWPQGIAWYVLGLIAVQQPEEAATALRAYLTLDGIRNSPNGQPALFEYREADPQSLVYGQIDKTTFLWAGGWYLHVLYHLAGIRENAWNISFDPNTPASFKNTAYDLMVAGQRSRVTWSGTGTAFKHIMLDGQPAASAVLTGPAARIDLERGLPDTPYLATATTRITDVAYRTADASLTVYASGITGQQTLFTLLSPIPLQRVRADGFEVLDIKTDKESEHGLYRLSIQARFTANTSVATFSF